MWAFHLFKYSDLRGVDHTTGDDYLRLCNKKIHINVGAILIDYDGVCFF